MAKETKTVQLYPDDNLINREVEIWNAFGWELLSNQMVQLNKGSDVNGNIKYESFNKLTFTREKNEVWYNEIIVLEDKYCKTLQEISRLEKVSDSGFNFIIFVLLFCCTFGIGGIIYAIKCSSRSKKKSGDRQARLKTIAKLKQEVNQTIAKAESLLTA